MGATENPFFGNVGQLYGLTSWWGVPGPSGAGAVDRQMKRLQQFAADCQKTCSNAYRDEMDLLFRGNERIGQSVQELLRSRRPPEVLAAESEIVATLLEGASLQARQWVAMTQKLQECCAAMARDAANDLRRQAQETTSTKGEGGSLQQPAKTASRHAGQTSPRPSP